MDSRRDANAQVKVVAGREGARGLLVIHRAAPMTDAEHSVLDALASQLAVMLENHRLFVETLDQARLVDIIGDSSDGVFIVSPDERDPFLEPGHGGHVERAGGRRNRSSRARAALG